MTFQTWIKQPSTITGIATVLGAGSVALAHVVSGDWTAAAGVGSIVFASTHLFVDDNTAAATEALASDVVDAAVHKSLAARLPALLNDAMVVAQSVAEKPVAKAAAMALLIAGLAGCTTPGAGQPSFVQVACANDAQLQPVAAELAPMIAAAVAGAPGAASAQAAVTLDVPLHMAIVQMCNGAQPAAVTVGGVRAAVVAPAPAPVEADPPPLPVPPVPPATK